MVEEDEGAADDAGEEADGPVDALAALLEVAEAAQLEGFELGVWMKREKRPMSSALVALVWMDVLTRARSSKKKPERREGKRGN